MKSAGARLTQADDFLMHAHAARIYTVVKSSAGADGSARRTGVYTWAPPPHRPPPPLRHA